jgi:DNA-binding HxlR family transcriptional regulator
MQWSGAMLAEPMLRNDYNGQVCSIAAALEVVGERWSLLIVREIFLGVRRFEEMQADLGIARNILQTRLNRLVDQGVLERRLYQERPPRHEYILTEKGLDLWPTLVSLMKWGDEHAPRAAGPPVLLEHRGCGGAVDEHRTCARCGTRLSVTDVRAQPGPGATPGHPLLRRAERTATASSAS